MRIDIQVSDKAIYSVQRLQQHRKNGVPSLCKAGKKNALELKAGASHCRSRLSCLDNGSRACDSVSRNDEEVRDTFS